MRRSTNRSRKRSPIFAVISGSSSSTASIFQGLRLRMDHEGRQGLTLNFRSQPAILDFTNALLGQRLTNYQPLRPHHSQTNPGPCVEFLWSACEDSDSAAMARIREAEG